MNNIYLVGDVRFTKNASLVFETGQIKAPIDFLLSLQVLMEEYEIVKLDVCQPDAIEYFNCKRP
ncbi:MAG: hypothetical protein V1781_09655 [Bacteroidota bacterium]